MQTILTQKEIESYIPHRYENMLIDKITLFQNNETISGDLEILIKETDPLGRHIFSQKKDENTKIIEEPFFMEILALASIVCTGKIPANHIAFFAGISNFKKENDFLIGNLVTGTVTQLKSKNGFYKYHGSLKNSAGLPIMSGELMAFIVDISNGMPRSEKKKTEFPASNTNIKVSSLNNFKPPEMFLADELTYFNKDNLEIVTKYTYPKTHPLTKGHFPGNPVMMGVMQWGMAEDACFILAQKLKETNQTGPYQIEADAQIIKADGILTTEIKQLKFDILTSGMVEICETKKIAFKEIVYPGDTLYTYLYNVKII